MHSVKCEFKISGPNSYVLCKNRSKRTQSRFMKNLGIYLGKNKSFFFQMIWKITVVQVYKSLHLFIII